ncbi:hypothetical protein JCM14450A_07120 [Geobacillus stearothermophilus]
MMALLVVFTAAIALFAVLIVLFLYLVCANGGKTGAKPGCEFIRNGIGFGCFGICLARRNRCFCRLPLLSVKR